MRKIYYLFLVFSTLFISKQSFGQAPQQDCINAWPICQNVYSQLNSYSGSGNIPNEITSGLSCLGSGELNSVWYVFTVQSPGTVCFSITPNNSNDDYDWAVYNLTNANCSDIATNAALEVSCNFSFNLGCGGVTGPNGQQLGPCGGQNESCIVVQTGETYVVNVSNFTTTQFGYTIDFSASTAVIFDNIPPSIASASNTCGNGTVNVSFSENILCSTVSPADFIFTGPGGPYTVTATSGAACNLSGVAENTFTITVSPAPVLVGTYTFGLVGSVTDNCGNIATLDSIDFIYPGISATASPDSICLGAYTVLTTSLGNNPVGYTFSWSNGGASPSTIVTPTSLPTTYTVTTVNAVGCIKAAMVTVNLIPGPTFDFTASDATPCKLEDINIQFVNNNVPSTSTPFWDFGGGTVVSGSGFGPYVVNWNTSGLKNISLYFLSDNGCYSDTVTHTVNVVADPIFDFTLPLTGCLNKNISLTYTGNVPTSTLNWLPSAGTTVISAAGSNPYVLSWTSPATYSVSLYLTSQEGCISDTITHTIDIDPKPIFDFTISDSVTCGNAPLVVGTTQPIPVGLPSWNFGGGNIISGGGSGPYQVAWATPGIKNISLFYTSPNGCISDTISHQLESIQMPSPNFMPVPPAICFGSPINFQYNNVLGTSQTYSWNFGANGTPSNANTQNASCLFANAGLQAVTFTTTYRGCTAQSSQNVTVYAEAIIDAGINTPFCEGGVNLQPTILSGAGPFSYVWTSPNPNANIANPTLANTFVSPLITSMYYLQAADVHNCPAKIDSVIITKYDVPAAQYTYTDNCVNQSLKFIDQTALANANLTNWSWTFGDGSIMQMQNPQHKYNTPNQYTVTLYVLANNGCRDTISHFVNVLPIPQPSFTAPRVCQNDTTFFTDLSSISPLFNTSIVNWAWQMEHLGTITGVQNPTYVFPTAGNYEITLTATSDSGCVNSVNRFIEIAAIPSMPEIVNDSVCFGKSVILMANATGIPSVILWYESMTDSIPFYQGQNLALAHLTENITYYVQALANSTSCRSTRKPIQGIVYPKTTAEILTQDPIYYLPGANVQFNYLATLGLTSWQWDFGDKATSDKEIPTHEYIYPARFPIYLLATDENGCIVEATHTIEVKRVITALVPSAFSPNADGINDVLTLGAFNLTSFQFQVFNRWGQMVFETSDPNKAWDGLDMSGKQAAEGSYIFTLKIVTFDNRNDIQSGTITLIR